MSVPDFITQVRNPDEEQQAEPVYVETKTINPPPKKSKSTTSCWSFLCCVSPGNTEESPPPEKRNTNVGRLTINSDPPDNNDRFGVNSPRKSAKYQGTSVYTDDHLLPPQNEKKKGKKCLVLDLDETLVHSSFKQVPCDFIVPVKIEDKTYKVYVAKRPHVDEFMRRCGELYEIVIFTASLAQYADPVVDLLDIHKVVDWRLFRESCTPFKGAYVKDMGRMGRDITQIMILDNSPHSYLFNRENAIPCETWYNDKNDRELLELIPIFEQLADPKVTDIRVAMRDMGVSPKEGNGDGLDSTGSEGATETSMEESDFTGSSEYSEVTENQNYQPS